MTMFRNKMLTNIACTSTMPILQIHFQLICLWIASSVWLIVRFIITALYFERLDLSWRFSSVNISYVSIEAILLFFGYLMMLMLYITRTQSNYDWLLVSQSRVTQADWMILDNEGKATTHYPPLFIKVANRRRAQTAKSRETTEVVTLQYIQRTKENGSWAEKFFLTSQGHGILNQSPLQCWKFYWYRYYVLQGYTLLIFPLLIISIRLWRP